MALWIDEAAAETGIDEIGFLVRVQNQNARGMPEHYQIRLRPAHTNQSHEPRMSGWCGTWNNVATYAERLAKIVRVTKNGRALIQRVAQCDEAAELEKLGYPELAD